MGRPTPNAGATAELSAHQQMKTLAEVLALVEGTKSNGRQATLAHSSEQVVKKISHFIRAKWFCHYSGDAQLFAERIGIQL